MECAGEAIWRQTYITPLLRRQHKCCRLRRGSDPLCLYGIRRVGSGKISASWEKGKNRSISKHWRSMVFFPISRPTTVGHLTCSEEPCRSVVWILYRVGECEKLRENGEVGGIGLERLVDCDPVLWCEDADGKRGSVITPIQQSSLKSKQTADTVNKCFADTAYCITNCFQCIFDDLTCFLRDLDNCFAYF